jgi:hypothetical protein
MDESLYNMCRRKQMLINKIAIMLLVIVMATGCTGGDTIADGNPNTTTYVDSAWYHGVQFSFVHQYYYRYNHGHVDCTIRNGSNSLVYIRWQVQVYKNGVLLQSTNTLQHELLPGEAKTIYNILYLTSPLTSYDVRVSVVEYEESPTYSF